MERERTDGQLLADYSSQGSESAFAELIRRHTDMVYSAALRQTRNPALAEEATSAVFLAVARKAPSLSKRETLAGWLIVAARREANGLLRQTARRVHREILAATMNAPSSPNPLDVAWDRMELLLDEALAALRD